MQPTIQQVYPQLKQCTYNCVGCGHVSLPFRQSGGATEVKPSSCLNCQSDGPFRLNTEKTIYRNYQKVTTSRARFAKFFFLQIRVIMCVCALFLIDSLISFHAAYFVHSYGPPTKRVLP